MERYLKQTANFQTVHYPQQFNTNDPWAGWYNSSIDLGAKWEEYYAQLEKMKSPEFYRTNYPVYEEPPPELDSAQFMPDEPLGEETYPFAPAPEELLSAHPDVPSSPVEEETPVQSAFDETPFSIEPEIPAEAAEEETEAHGTEAQATDEELREESNAEEIKEQEFMTAESVKPVAEADKEEVVTSSKSIIVWKNFPPK